MGSLPLSPSLGERLPAFCLYFCQWIYHIVPSSWVSKLVLVRERVCFGASQPLEWLRLIGGSWNPPAMRSLGGDYEYYHFLYILLCEKVGQHQYNCLLTYLPQSLSCSAAWEQGPSHSSMYGRHMGTNLQVSTDRMKEDLVKEDTLALSLEEQV